MTDDTATTPRVAPLAWKAEDLAGLSGGRFGQSPVITGADVLRVGPEIDVWDAWPLAEAAGTPVPWQGGELWFALAAPALADPEERHAVARIHAFHRTGKSFRDLGPALPDGLSPGSREWSGAARLEGDRVALYFTAAGDRGEGRPSFRQRLYVTRARLTDSAIHPFDGWTLPEELLRPGSGPYQEAVGTEGRIGEIKAFRDPFPWREDDGREYLLFTGSSAAHPGAFNGLVGLAVQDNEGRYRPLPPLVDASGTNNELERPHIVVHEGRLYLFWSTQAKVFAPGIAAPTGLYGATATSMSGPWHLLNGHGLVFANPEREPFQAYSWWVLPDLAVASFVDYWRVDNPGLADKPSGRSHFGGTFAPFLRLRLAGTGAGLA